MHWCAKFRGDGQCRQCRPRLWPRREWAAICAAPAQADVTGRYAYSNSDRRLGPPVEMSMTVEVSDKGDFRLQLPGVPYYVLSLNRQLYLVKSTEGAAQVMRAEDIDTLFAEAHAGSGHGRPSDVARGARRPTFMEGNRAHERGRLGWRVFRALRRRWRWKRRTDTRRFDGSTASAARLALHRGAVGTI
jgi:hypothetical protein